MKRQRNRGRKQSVNNENRHYESNGPDIKVKGNAAQLYEKYIQLARDASANGDRIKTENYFQHAEHYFRLRELQSQKLLNEETLGARQVNPEKNRTEVSQHASASSKSVQGQKNGPSQKKDKPSHSLQKTKKTKAPRGPLHSAQNAFEIVETEACELVMENGKAHVSDKKTKSVARRSDGTEKNKVLIEHEEQAILPPSEIDTKKKNILSESMTKEKQVKSL